MRESQSLQERYDEMHEYLLSEIDNSTRLLLDLRYLRSFITYKNLDDEFIYFRKHAHEEYEKERPFSFLTL